MFADRRRFDLLRRFQLLEVKGGHSREALERAARNVVSLLSHAVQLEWLRIEEFDYLEVHKPLPRALSSLTKLRSLHLTDVDAATTRIVKALTMSLAEISLSCYGNKAYEDPSEFLAPFKDTMRKIILSHVEMLSVAGTPAPFPLVRTLHLDRCGHVDLQALEDCFPNLRRLYLQHDEEVEDTSEIEEERFLNLARDARPWDSLSMLRGTVAGLYSLGISCSVEHLDVDTEWPVVEPDDYMRLTSLLAALCPTVLELSLNLPDLDTDKLEKSLSVTAGTLKYLRLVLHWDKALFDPHEDLDSLLDSLPRTTLQYLQIKFHYDPDPKRPSLRPSSHLCSVVGVAYIDTFELARSAFYIPTLRYFCLESDPMSRPRPEMFEVREDDEGERVPVKLPWDARTNELSQESPFPMDG
ncbi:hypothetical protein PsYK624_041470 [Phanerochaete sordida]|uniref:F-box domain-containing protein n=1 Tax=Phanerochaete sordida TaxID=48140 RepID=A0A9P3G559_9APHY|nr:hypothetical protein PsYK624_041470 [Phanerochaete sordida]